MSISFKKFDYLGFIFGFTYDESVRLQTHCGGILSVLFAILSIVIISIMGSSIFDRANPIIVQNLVKSTSSPTITFRNTYNIAIRMTSGNFTLFQNLDKVRIKLMLNYVYNSNYNNVTLKEIPLSVCTKDKFPSEYQDYFDLYFLNESLCPDLTSQFITGDFLSLNMQYLQVQFQLCENDPITGKSNDGTNIVCKNSSEIQNFLEQNLVKAHLFSTETYYSETNYTNPEIKYVDNYNINIYFSSQRETQFYLTNSNLTSDDSYFFLAPSSRQFSNIDNSKISERAAFREPQMKNFVNINIKSDKGSIAYQRSYRGLADIAANIGAILNISLIFFSCGVFIFSRIEYFNRLVKNTTFLYNKNPNVNLILKKSNNDKVHNKIIENTLKGTMIQESKPTMTLNQSNDNTPNITEVKLLKTIIQPNELISLNKTEKSQTHIPQTNLLSKQPNKNINNIGLIKFNNEKTFFENALISFCPCLIYCNKNFHRDSKIMEYSMKHYYNYTDFFKFLDNYIELNMFKDLILKKDEKEMLDIIKKTIVAKNNDIISIIKDQKLNNKDSKTTASVLKVRGSLVFVEEKLRDYLNTLSNKDIKTTFEKNFIELFDSLTRT